MKQIKYNRPLLALASLLTFVPSLTLANGFDSYGGGMMGSYADHGGAMGVGGSIIMILFISLVVLGIFALYTYLKNNVQKTDKVIGSTALSILSERYAKGEIDKEEFDAKKKDLMG